MPEIKELVFFKNPKTLTTKLQLKHFLEHPFIAKSEGGITQSAKGFRVIAGFILLDSFARCRTWSIDSSCLFIPFSS
jgi:hypothetical protein